jgi:hypothetical protein
MPKPLWIYLIALLYFTKVSACSTIAEVFPKASHDCLTRMLNGDWSGYSGPENLDYPLRSELEQTSRPKRGESI